MFDYIFQDYFEANDLTKKKIKCIFKAFIWPSVPSEKICVWIRLCHYFTKKGNKYLKQKFQRSVYKKFNCSISCEAIIGKGLFLPHPQNIVIGEGVVIGNNATIYQGVTLGRETSEKEGYAVVGNNVMIYCNSSIIGKVNVGDNVTIGAHSLVLDDVGSGKVVAGCPAKELH